MLRSPKSVAVQLLLCGAVAAGALGCSGGSDESEQKPTTTASADVEEAAVTTVTTVSGTCADEELQSAAAAAQASATISEKACYGDAGVALLVSDEVADGVVFFRFGDGAWAVVAVEPRDATLADRVPEGFPSLLFSRWWKSHAPEGALSSGGETGSVGGGAGAEGNLDDDVFYDSETTTTTTAPPTTTTTAPPETTTTERQLDPYCIQFPEEPSCLEDPYLP